MALRVAGIRIAAPGLRMTRAPLGDASSARAATGSRRATIARIVTRARVCMANASAANDQGLERGRYLAESRLNGQGSGGSAWEEAI